MILKVKRGGSILGPNNVQYTSGQVIPSGLLSAGQIREHQRSGYLQVIRSRSEVAPTVEQVKAAGYSQEAAEQIAAEAAARASEEDRVENAPGAEPVAGISESGRPVEVKSRWSFDPDALRGKPLDELSVMILEKDDTIDPFGSVEEAVAWLSQDYVAPTL